MAVTTTALDALDRAAEVAPDHVAIICGDSQITYREYRRAVAALAADLKELDCTGQRVVVLMGNSIEMSVAIYAIWAAGGVIVLLNPGYPGRELAPLIADAAPRAVLCEASLREIVDPIAQEAGVAHVMALGDGATTFEEWLAADERPLPAPRPGPDDPASLQYTGGTTGVPKGARHNHAGIVHMTRQTNLVWPAEPGTDVWLNVAAQFHIWGLCMTAIMPVDRRDTLVLIRKYDPELMLASMARYGVTFFAGGPSPIYRGLMAHPDFETTDFSSLRLCVGGGAPFALETVRAWEDVTGTVIHEGYGMSEIAPISLNPSPGENRIGTCGPPVPGIEVEIIDVETGTKALPPGEDGEVRVRGPQMMLGYWQRPEETAETVRDGWIHTGDIGHLDEKGYIVIVDRKKDMAIVNGYNVFPREIDEVLFTHPAVLDAAAIGVPDEKIGEVIHAYAVPRDDVALDGAEVIAFCADRLAKHKVPARVIVVDQLPKTPAAKVDRRALRQLSIDAG